MAVDWLESCSGTACWRWLGEEQHSLEGGWRHLGHDGRQSCDFPGESRRKALWSAPFTWEQHAWQSCWFPPPSSSLPYASPSACAATQETRQSFFQLEGKIKLQAIFLAGISSLTWFGNISAQTLPLAAERASGGKWKKQLGVEEGGEGWMCNCTLQGWGCHWGWPLAGSTARRAEVSGFSSVQGRHQAAESSHAHEGWAPCTSCSLHSQICCVTSECI